MRRIPPTLLGAALVSAFYGLLQAETPEPASVLSEPTLTLSKSPGTGEIVLAWTGTTGPYSVVRSTNPDFFGAVTAQIIASGLAVTTFRDPVLNDGITYFYAVEDALAPPRVYSMSGVSGLPGDSIVLTGTGFSSTLSDNEVFVTGVQAAVTGVTSTTLTFTVPDGALTGNVTASTPNGTDQGRLLYVIACCSPTLAAPLTVLSNISSLAVNSVHTPFVADTGTSATSDRVFTFNPSAGTMQEVGFLNEATGLPVSATNQVYYGNALRDAANTGNIERTTSVPGSETFYNNCGNVVGTDESCNPFAIGIDSSLTDFGADGRVYVADGAAGRQKVRIVPPTGVVTDFATGFAFGTTSPRGLVVDTNTQSPFHHHVFVADSTSVRVFPGEFHGFCEEVL